MAFVKSGSKKRVCLMNEVIVKLNSNDLQPFFNNLIKRAMLQAFNDLGDSFFVELLKKVALNEALPEWIQGDKEAAKLLGISPAALTMRRRSGEYIEGVDFFKKSAKMVMWRKTALLTSRSSNGSKTKSKRRSSLS